MFTFVYMTANIHIDGDIGKYENPDGSIVDGVVLVDVIQQIKQYENPTRIKVNIRTAGGSIQEGEKIKDYLQSLNIPIDTYGYGMVASMGTSIFLIGKNRELQEGTDFYIHLPQGGVSGDSESIMEYAKEITHLQKNLVKEYKEVTNLSDEALMHLLRDETTLTVNQAYDLGFANYKSKSLQPVAYFNKNNNMSDTTEIDKKFNSFFEKIENLFKKRPTNMIAMDVNGTEIDFPDLEDGQPYSLGLKAKIDGKDAEGEYVMPSGMTFVFLNGELIEMKEPEEEEELQAKLDSLIKELTESQNTIEALKVENQSLSNEKDSLQELIEKSKVEFTNFKKELKTTFNYEFKKEKEEEKETKVNNAKAALKKIRESRKK